MATRGQALHGAAGKAANFGIIAAFAAFAAFPFAWMLITMFKQNGDLLDPGHVPFIYNLPPTLDNLRVLFNDTLFVHYRRAPENVHPGPVNDMVGSYKWLLDQSIRRIMSH